MMAGERSKLTSAAQIAGRGRTPREVLSGGRLKGGMFRAHLAWVREFKTEAEQKQLMSDLPAEAQKDLSGVVLATSWYPFEWLVALDKAINRRFGNSENHDLIIELGRYSARLNLATTYRVFNRNANHDFFRNAAPLHSQFQDFGSAEYVQTGEKSGKVLHRDYPCFSPVFCASALGYYEQAILSHDAKEATVRETECQCYGDKTCTFELSWS